MRENSEEEKSQQGELKVEEGPDMEEESITVIERDFFKDKNSLDAKGEPEEKILSLQEKRKEMEEKLAFEGEIPDDPDDFQEKAAIPPTSMEEGSSFSNYSRFGHCVSLLSKLACYPI